MTLTIIYIIFTALAVIDLLTISSARREARRLAQSLYAQPVEQQQSFQIPARFPEALRDYIIRSGILEKEPGTVVRMRRKGVLRWHEKGNWQPFEGKFFISVLTPAMVEFSDVTTGLFCSRSILHAISPEGFKWSEKRWGLGFRPSFFDRADIGGYLLLEYFAAGAWCPYIWLQSNLNWEEGLNGELVVKPDANLALTLHFSDDGLPKRLSGNVGNSTITYTYSDYQHLGGALLPLHWTLEISGRGTRYTHLHGQVTDIVTEGNFAWW